MSGATVTIFESPDFDAEIARVVEALRGGELVALPTETVYGVAGLLASASARERLAGLRSQLEPGAPARAWVPHVAGVEVAAGLLGGLTEFQKRAMRKLWPGPVGLVLEVPAEIRAAAAGRLGVAEPEVYDGPSITLRCPDHPVAAEVLRKLGVPLILTRGLRAGLESGQRLSDLDELALRQVKLAVDAGTTRYHRPSTLLRLHPDRYEMLRVGVFDQRIIERLLRSTLLFVCSGNTCRSPMAWSIARARVAEALGISPEKLEERGVSVLSAGTMAVTGARATAQAVEAVRGLGADLSGHRSRPLSVELIHSADRIYVMGRSHLAAVLAMAPAAREKVKPLDPDGDIEDPIGSDVGNYRRLAERLDSLIRVRLAEDPLP